MDEHMIVRLHRRWLEMAEEHRYVWFCSLPDAWQQALFQYQTRLHLERGTYSDDWRIAHSREGAAR